MTNLRSLAADTRGVTALEYALIAAIVGVVIVGAMQGVGNSLLQNFEIIVEAAREDPQPMQVADMRLPTPPVEEAPQAAPAPVPDLDDDESTEPPAVEAGAPDSSDVSEPPQPTGQEPGIAPSEPSLGPWEDGVPVTALVTPPGRESSRSWRAGRAGPRPGLTSRIPDLPPGAETSADSEGTEPETEVAVQHRIPEQPLFTDRQKAAIRSAFILLLWTLFTLGLANLIWRIATRKAHEKEVEDQLEDWQPASFG